MHERIHSETSVPNAPVFSSWLISIHLRLSVVAFYLMASQDQISHFTQDSMRISAAQQDRSRTLRRPHHDWHQPVPTFHGPMHYAMTTPRPSWPPTGPPAPPPLSSTFPSRPTWTPTPPTPLFPPTPSGFSQGLHDHTTFTPHQDRRCL